MTGLVSFTRALGRGIVFASVLAGSATLAMAQQGVELIQNRWTPAQYVTVQGGQPVAGPSATTSQAAQWTVEQTGEPNVIRLRNVGSGSYLIGTAERLGVGPAGGDGQDANWTLERVPGNPDVRIRSNSTGGYLHTKDGPLVLGEASPSWQQSFWKFVAASAGARVAEATPTPIPVPPSTGCAARNGRWLWIGGKHVCAHRCPPDTHRVGNACVVNHKCPPGSHIVGGICVKSCKPGFHPVGGLCVKTCAPGFHPVGNVCIKNGPKPPKPPVCGPGQHMSKGHCCPNGKNWNNGLKKCM